MSTPVRSPVTGKVVSREAWLSARLELLQQEKEITRRRDQLSRLRRELPWVKVDKQYLFHTPQGQRSLADLFAGRSQLVLYHFMFAPEWNEGCPSCSFVADHIDGAVPHLAARDVTLTLVARAPLDKIDAFKQRMGWHFPWVSSFGSDFNYDYHVSLSREPQASMEAPGVSVFCKDAAGAVFHTYSTYQRGLEPLLGTYTLLDLVPKGRDEDHLPFSMEWLRHHDRYGTDIFLDPSRPYWPPTASPVAGSKCACPTAESPT